MHYLVKTFAELTATEVFEIFRLRQEIFIVEQECAYPDMDDTDFICHHVMGKNSNDQVVAYSRLVPTSESQSHVSIGRIVVHESLRGQGVGKDLVRNSIVQIKILYPDHQIKISAQKHLIPFYQDVGFEPYGQVYLEDGIPHIGMLVVT